LKAENKKNSIQDAAKLMVIFYVSSAANSILAGAPPQTQLMKLTALPTLSSCGKVVKGQRKESEALRKKVRE